MTARSHSAGQSSRGWHRLQAWMACRRLWAYQYLLRLVPKRESPGKALGSLVHIGLMHRALRQAGNAAVMDPIEAMRQAPSRIAYCFDAAAAILRGYDTAYPVDPWRVLDVEREFEVQVGGYRTTQRMDVTVEWDGGVAVVDHKTTSGRPSAIAREFEMSGQFLLMDAIGRSVIAPTYGLEWGGCWIDAIVTRAPYEFERVRVRIRERLVEANIAAIADANGEIAAALARKGGAWTYRCSFGSCQGRWGRCEYESLCCEGEGAVDEYDVMVDEASEIEV